jgi:hypothetical protein
MPAATKKTSFRLTDGQLVILNGAAQRPDRRVLPPLGSLTIKGAALTRTLAGLLKRGLVAEEHAAAEDPLWRSTDAGERLRLVLTDAGLRALGIEDAADEPGDAERAAAEVAVPVLNERVNAAPNETAAEAPRRRMSARLPGLHSDRAPRGPRSPICSPGRTGRALPR